MQISLNNYNNLLLKIQKTIEEKQQNIIKSVNHEKVVMSWEIGKIIDEYLLKNSRLDYGKKLFSQLEKDTAIKEKTLYQMRSFYKAYPTLPEAEKNLSWSHYRSLSSIKNDEKRQYFEELTINDNLGAVRLQKEISKINAKKAARRKQVPANKKPTKLSVTRGHLFTYKIVTLKNNKTYIDCGFKVFTEAKTGFENGEIVESAKKNAGFVFKKSSANSKQLHTYKAFLDKVIDGDTLNVTLDLGFKIQHQEILRLAKINAPEKETFEGNKSTKALEKILKNVKFLIIKTNKTDIYGRYIADVFFSENEKDDEQKIADEGIYLNQMLIDLGAAEVF